MRYVLLLLCINISVIANAQKNIRYTGSIEGGLLLGSSKPASSFVFTTQGVAYKQFGLSVGTGIDFYPFRSVPLFVEVKRKFTNNSVQPFIMAATGINFTSTGSHDAQLFHLYAGEGNFKNGFFAKGGGGLIFLAQQKWKLSLSGGYSYKATAYAYKPIAGGPQGGQIQPLEDRYRYNRWYVSVGVLR